MKRRLKAIGSFSLRSRSEDQQSNPKNEESPIKPSKKILDSKRLEVPVKGDVKSDGSLHIESIKSRPHELEAESSFFALHTDIQGIILHALDPVDIFSLRISSRKCCHLVELFQASLARQYVKIQADRRRCNCKIWSLPGHFFLDHFYQSYHRHVVLQKVTLTLMDFIAMELYGCSTRSAISRYRQQHQMLPINLYPILEHISHFLEEYRGAFANATHSYSFEAMSPREVKNAHHQLELAILDDLSNKCLCECSVVFRLLLMALNRRLRPPINATKLERSLRGWNRPAATSDELVRLLLLGGLREIARVLSNPSYAARRQSLDAFLAQLESGPAAAAATATIRPSRKLPQLAVQSKGFKNDNSSTSLPLEDCANGPDSRLSPSSSAAAASIPRRGLHTTPELSAATISQMCQHLPGIYSILVPVSEQLLVHRGYIDSADQLPSPRRFVSWASSLESDAAGEEHVGGDGALDQEEAYSSLAENIDDDDEDDDSADDGSALSFGEASAMRLI